MVEFTECSGCKECPLWENAKHPGIVTRVYKATGKDKALLIVGEAPGYQEDTDGVSWVGKTGQLLSAFIDASGLADYADVYLSNACRCRPLKNNKPTNGQINICRQHLLKDYRRLAMEYPKGVIILACGGSACFSVAKHKSITAATRKQGQPSTILTYTDEPFLSSEMQVRSDNSHTAPVCFFTYHPALLFPGRQPGKVYAVESHFELLKRYLTGNYVPDALNVTPLVGAEVPSVEDMRNLDHKMVTVDIETYGILRRKEQTGFCPIKSLIVDSVPYHRQVVTVAFGYKDNQGKIHTPVYRFDNPKERQQVVEWFRRISQSKLTVVGQNIKFDLLYLASGDKELGYWIDPARITLDDTLLISFLLYDLQPEKGLKEISKLFGIADYNQLKVTGKSGTAASSSDPDLLLYNAMDVHVTYVLYEQLWERILTKYGSHSDKLSDACRVMRNQVLWDVFNLERAGCTFDKRKLTVLDTQLRQQRDEAVAEAEKYGTKLQGTGSKASVLELLTAAVQECVLQDDPRVILTEKRREISTGKANRQLVKQYLDSGDIYEQIVLLDTFKKVDKLIGSYTNKLLYNNRDGITKEVYGNSSVGIAYPSWYPVPSPHSNKGGETETKIGGTVQGRLSCTRPAAQTFPPVVSACRCSRFLPGVLKSYDLSQIELRMAALLSGDPVLMDAYLNHIDLHSQTAQILYPGVPVGTEGWSAKRKLAKRLNFLVLYKGGAVKFMEVVQAEDGITLDFDFCRDCIWKWDNGHRVFREWQKRLIEEVMRVGYLELPTGWSRTFGAGAEPPVNEICNFPLQTTAAQLLQSAEYAIDMELRKRRLRAVITLQVHDSIEIDMPVIEEKIVDSIVDKYLTRPPLLSILEDKYNRTIPIEYEGKELAVNGYAHRQKKVS